MENTSSTIITTMNILRIFLFIALFLYDRCYYMTNPGGSTYDSF